MADFFSDPNEWTDEGAVRLNSHHKRRAFAETRFRLLMGSTGKMISLLCLSVPHEQIRARK